MFPGQSGFHVILLSQAGTETNLFLVFQRLASRTFNRPSSLRLDVEQVNGCKIWYVLKHLHCILQVFDKATCWESGPAVKVATSDSGVGDGPQEHRDAAQLLALPRCHGHNWQ